MYLLQSHQSTYLTKIRQILPTKNFTLYSGKTLLDMVVLKSGDYRCTLLRRFDVVLENTTPSVVNDLMIDLGQSLYPIVLNIASDGKICKIENFSEIKERRTEKAMELLRHYETVDFSKYIEMSLYNIEDEKRLLKCIARDSFIQLFFSCASAQSFNYTCENFPKNGQKSSYNCRISKVTSNTCFYIGEPVFYSPSMTLNGEIITNLTAESILSGISAKFICQEAEEDSYVREIKIQLLEKESVALKH